ncbi:hypothetical protein DY000_02054031, partial [Brassica cretica]
MSGKFSPTLSLGDLNDFIALSQVCVISLKAYTYQLKECFSVLLKVVINPKQQFEPVKISLKDCLACRSLLPQQVSDFIEFETYYISKLVMSLRVVTSKLVQKIVNIVRRVKTGKCEYQYVEIMACPAGCLNCVGQSQKALVNSLEATYMNYV